MEDQRATPPDEVVAGTQPPPDEVAGTQLPRLGRRSFLKLGSVGSAAAVLAACAAPPAPPTVAPPTAAPAPTAPQAPTPVAVTEPAPAPMIGDLLPYPRLKIATIADLQKGVFFATYPDQFSPVQILKLGVKTVGGVGPDEDIVAYSGLCTHMGCPVSYDPATRIFMCPCHYSYFDAAADAMLISGPATQHLPRIVLEVEGQDIYAIGVQGLIYGRPHNLSLTKP
ncbi:MAG: arsenate reductase (azurin) small subunit [Oscillochloridaceae bacterium]|nr:arsenate reductase (azurin) small subunit [Chloroflexaceae bacterium]MDW8391484.1 arsenate reductase (azurin) small subunit [Oscillochloridaceae bacterium]